MILIIVNTVAFIATTTCHIQFINVSYARSTSEHAHINFYSSRATFLT